MKKILKFSFAVIVASTLNASNTFAAFPIKQESKTELATLNVSNDEASSALLSETKVEQQKQVIKASKHHKKGNSAIPQGLYILLSIFFLGWLAMGINSDWDGYDWLISLLLYILLWLPGFIFSMIKMKDYY